MGITTQVGIGASVIVVGADLPYYTRSFEIITDLLLSTTYNGDVYLGAINRYHKCGQIFALYKDAVVWQKFLEYPIQYHGVYIRAIDTPFPIFTVLDGVTWDGNSPETKNIDNGTASAEPSFYGLLNWVQMIIDTGLGAVQTVESYLMAAPLKLFTKFKPGLMGISQPVDMIIVEVFRDDVTVDIQLNPIR